MEELFLTFAKKASAFNSWFENVEEDLTDSVRCNSVEEIKVAVEKCFIPHTWLTLLGVERFTCTISSITSFSQV